MKTILKVAFIASCLVALVAVAGAQEQLNFADLPLVSTPSPIPNGYGSLGWDNFYYVDPFTWSGSGPGFQLGTPKQDVAFLGVRTCRPVENACFGTISNAAGLQLVSARVAAGFGPTTLTVAAYNNGTYVGSSNYFIDTNMRSLQFPSKWGIVTQVVFQVTGVSDSLVVYNLAVYTLGR